MIKEFDRQTYTTTLQRMGGMYVSYNGTSMHTSMHTFDRQTYTTTLQRMGD